MYSAEVLSPTPLLPQTWVNAVRVVAERTLPRIGIPALDPAGGGGRGYFFEYTIYGRYLLALGRNEEAAKSINTDCMLILAYVIGLLLAGLGGVLFVMM